MLVKIELITLHHEYSERLQYSCSSTKFPSSKYALGNSIEALLTRINSILQSTKINLLLEGRLQQFGINDSLCSAAHNIARHQIPATLQRQFSVLYSATVSVTRSYFIFIGTLSISRGKASPKQKLIEAANLTEVKGRDWEIQFHPARWLWSNGYMLSKCMSLSNWQHRITSYNIRDDRSPIFDACRYGNLEWARTLLDQGLASPFDVTPDGMTPLHVPSTPFK